MISLLVINYRSAALAIEAIRSARAAAALTLEVVVVDNSVDRDEAEQLRPHCDQLLTPDKNLGYAGGINAGRAQCHGEVIIVTNPDVVFGRRSIDELARTLQENDDVAVAGPALFWDDAFSWILPPSEAPTAATKFSAALATRSKAYARVRDRRRIRRRIDFWSRTSTMTTNAISGAVMAIRSRDFDRVSGFDERFPLYFEENDFLRRITRAGRRIAYVPSARVRHVYNQSAGADRDAPRRFAESETLFFSKWYGDVAARLLKRMERVPRIAEPPAINGAIQLPSLDVVIEATPLATFETAAGHVPTTTKVELPSEVWQSYLSPVLYLRVIDRQTARVIATYARYRS